jgi:uncharacterized protein (TIGR03083 family)
MYKETAAASLDSRAWDMYAAERADVRDFLAPLTPEQWNAPSLCQGWRVRDVAVHLLVDEPLEQLGVVRALVKAATFKFSVHRINEWWIARNRERATSTIVAAFDGPWRPGRISKMLGPGVGMRAVVIHHQDMRRALEIPRAVPEERLRAALDAVLTPRGSTNLGSYERATGLRLQADDINWSWGNGPEVSGTAEAILMAVAGRPSALADLSGEGLPVLAERVPQPRGAR